MRRWSRALCLGACVLLTAAADGGLQARQAERAAFTEGPHAVRLADGTVRLTFAVSAATDVEVAVLDAKGTTVRHLAAGKLGPNAPEPFKKDALGQALLWDGKDDSGNAAGAGPFTIRVGLGLTAAFERLIGWSGQNVDGPCGLVCGPDGTLYVVSSGGLYAHRTTWLVTAFDRDGKYLRQVFPGPSGLPAEKRKGWPHVTTDDGREVPVVQHVLSRCVYPGAALGGRVMPAATGDGRLVILTGGDLGSNIKHPDVRGGRRLLILGTDGSVPADFLGPVVAPENYGGYGRLAISPDDKWVYVTGLCERKGKEARHCQVVWRLPLDGSAPPKTLIGTLFETGAGRTGLNDPQGLAVDKAGNLYVADAGNNRVVAFAPDGAFLGEVAVENPDSVLVSRKTGAIYVMCLEPHKKPLGDQHYYVPAHNWKASRVVKFKGLGETAAIASLDKVTTTPMGGGAYMALDESADPPVLWLGGLRYGGGPVLKVIDEGASLSAPAPVIDQRIPTDATPLPFIGDVAVSGSRVIARYATFSSRYRPEALAFDAASGAPLPPFVPKTPEGKAENYWSLVYGEMTSGKDGRLYVHAKDVLRRYEPTGAPAPFESVKSHILPDLPFDRHTHTSTVFVNRAGEIYMAVYTGGAGAQALNPADICIYRIAPDGTVINNSLVKAQGARLGGLAVDSTGHVYLGAQIAPPGGRLPEWARGKLPADSEGHFPSTAYKQYGAILKFPPTGGAVHIDGNGPLVAHRQGQSKVSISGGRLLARGGLVPGKTGPESAGCNCEVSRFDIDPYDRLYVPDVFRFSVLVLDREGNELTRFGTYGNMDSPNAPGQIPLGWPLSVKESGGRAFVADLVNRRLVAVRLAPAVSQTCEVK